MTSYHTLNEVIEDHITRFISLLTKDLTRRRRMLEIWRGGVGGESTPVVNQISCRHRMRSGPNIGTPCGKKASPKSTTRAYCTQHLKFETTTAMVAAKKAQAKKALEEVVSTVPASAKLNSALSRAQVILFKTLRGRLVDPTTQLIFDSKRMAVGKEVNGEFQPLRPADVDFCARQGIACKV